MLRIIKISTALILLFASLWALLLPPYFPSSSHSIVNARRISIETVTEGLVNGLNSETHARVAKGDTIINIERQQRELEREFEQLNFLKKRLLTQIENTDASWQQRSADLERILEDYKARKASSIQLFTADLEGLSAQKIIYEKELKLLKEDASRMQQLLNDGIITQNQFSSSQRKLVETERMLRHSSSEMILAQRKLQDAQKGLQLSASETNDGLSAEISTLHHEIRSLEEESETLKTQILEVNQLIDSTEGYLVNDKVETIRSPIEAVIWRKEVVNGENVVSGQTVLQLADVDSIFVEAFFNRHYLESITPGDHAHIFLMSESRYIDGYITDVLVMEDDTSGHRIVNTVSPNQSMLRVIISVPATALDAAHIGQVTKVLVSSAEPGLMKKSLVWLSFLLRSHK